MTGKQIMIIACLVLFVALTAVAGVFFGGRRSTSPSPTPQNGASANEVPRSEALELLKNAPAAEGFTDKIPASTTPTAPQSAIPAGPGSSAASNTYELRMSSSGFAPDSIGIRSGDTTTIRITAVDGDYDVRIPYIDMRADVRKGQTKVLMFTVRSTGTFLIECDQKCPPSGKVQGTLVVLPK